MVQATVLGPLQGRDVVGWRGRTSRCRWDIAVEVVQGRCRGDLLCTVAFPSVWFEWERPG